MSESSFFSDLLASIAQQGRRLLGPAPEAPRASGLDALRLECEALLESTGEASRIAVARSVLDHWAASGEEVRAAFFLVLRQDFGPDRERLAKAVEAWGAAPTPESEAALHEAAEPRRQELIRRLALAPDGMAGLMRMREALLRLLPVNRSLKVVDDDFAHLFSSWFNRGFLVLRPIDWTTPANVLEKIIRYEAVHEIRDWEELRRRLEPPDRRCFAFFHPRLVDEPLIFVEVALTQSMPESVAEVLDPGREPIRAEEAGAAVFYSISNCQDGLRGVSFGNFLIKQVVEDLRRDLPEIATFVTLSPVPGFAEWLSGELADPASDTLAAEDRETLAALEDRGWMDDEPKAEALRPALARACAIYLVHARNRRGQPADPVARFHLGNGARLERVNVMADRSPRAERQAHGMMVNYLYELDEIEQNHEAYAARGKVAASTSVKRLARRPKAAEKETEAAR
ncbi:malonyl-CoA decarboxylase [Chenggangzhangella methanolivorans]|uniref:malonyl-CoA decarboxylase n=1 Tax=Chenggangzhangella methanolivorans TaxID=1437009 RepID=UPI0036169E9B